MDNADSTTRQVMSNYAPSILIGVFALYLLWLGSFSSVGLFSRVPDESELSEVQGVIVSRHRVKRAIRFKMDTSPLTFYYGSYLFAQILYPKFRYVPGEIVVGKRFRVWYDPKESGESDEVSIWQLATDDSFLVKYRDVKDVRQLSSYIILPACLLAIGLSFQLRLLRKKGRGDKSNTVSL